MVSSCRNCPGNFCGHYSQPGPDQRFLYTHQRGYIIEFLAKNKNQLSNPAERTDVYFQHQLVSVVICVMVVLIFKESDNMEAAYGLSITITMMITTFLMISYLSMKRVPVLIITVFFCVYLLIEGSFLYANLFKFSHGGWFTILIAGILVIDHAFVVPGPKDHEPVSPVSALEQYIDTIKDLRNDISVPKTCTNLVYLTKANRKSDVEAKIILSIFNKQPKRADHYWLIHVDILDDPRTMEYKVSELIPGILTRVDFFLGFKVERRIHPMFKHITNELGKAGAIDLFSGYPSLRKHNILTDFRFIIIDRLNISDLTFKFFDKLIINYLPVSCTA